MNIAAPAAVTRPAVPADLAGMVELQSRAFGPGRFVRTAYRVREGGPDLSPFLPRIHCEVSFWARRDVRSLKVE